MISVIVSGNRYKKWSRLYSQLAQTEKSFEMVVVGNMLPEARMPANFHFIYSNVKPAQCVEIAFRYSVGDYVFFISDDAEFDKFTLDKLYELEKLNDQQIISTRLTRKGVRFPLREYKYWPSVSSTPDMPVGIFCTKELWNKIGGIDNRFISSMWDLDFALRHYESGGRVIYAEDVNFEEADDSYDLLERLLIRLKIKKVKKGLYASVGALHDRPVLERLWTASSLSDEETYGINHETNRVLLKKRLDKVQKFVDRQILTVSQGELHARWQ